MAMVTAAQVISTVPFARNLDEDFITHLIEPTQLSDLRDVMCSGFYDGAVSSGWLIDGETLSGLESTASSLMSDYVLPYLKWQIAVQCVPFIRTQVQNNGLFSGVAEQSQKSSPAEISNIEARLQQTASMYRERLHTFLQDNETTFVTYRKECGCKEDSSVFKTFGII